MIEESFKRLVITDKLGLKSEKIFGGFYKSKGDGVKIFGFPFSKYLLNKG